MWVSSVSTSNELINKEMTIRRIASYETVVLGLDASVAALAALEHPFSLLESERDADTALTEAKTTP